MMIAILYEIKPKNPLTLIRKTQAVQKRAILLPPLYSSRALENKKARAKASQRLRLDFDPGLAQTFSSEINILYSQRPFL